MDLIYESNWEQATGITPEEAANRAREMFDLYLKSGDTGECDDMACCETKAVMHRINPDTGRPEISTDNGATWTTDPQDVNNLAQLMPPIVTDGGSSTKCDAATNASEHINDLIAATSTNIGAAGSVFELTVAIAEAVLAAIVFLVTGGAASPIILAVATAIWAAGSAAFELGKDAFDTYWSSDKKDAILCALYCNIGENGQFTEAQYQAWRAKVKSQLPASPALDIVMTSINAGGAVGLSNMASYGNAADADCSSCECDDSLHVWIGDLVNPSVEIFPNESGVYTAVQSGTPTGDGFYWIQIGFKHVLDDVTFTPCAGLDVLTGLPGYFEKYDCHTGTLDALSPCTWAFGFRNNAPFTMTFTATKCT